MCRWKEMYRTLLGVSTEFVLIEGRFYKLVSRIFNCAGKKCTAPCLQGVSIEGQGYS